MRKTGTDTKSRKLINENKNFFEWFIWKLTLKNTIFVHKKEKYGKDSIYDGLHAFRCRAGSGTGRKSRKGKANQAGIRQRQAEDFT